VLEAIAAIDASVAWNVMLGSEVNAMAAGGMDPALAKQLFVEEPRAIMCGGGGPGSTPARAVRQPDGSVEVWARTTFMSGSPHSHYAFIGAPLQGPGGEPVTSRSGRPIYKTWMLHRDQWTIADTWDMAGLRGSGSHDIVVDGGVVPSEHTRVDMWAVPAHYPNPVFRMPIDLRLAFNKAAISLGVARGALATFAETGRSKRGAAAARVGVAQARYQSSRAYLLDALARVEAELVGNDRLPGPGTTQYARLACTHAGNECMELVAGLHNAAGTSAMRIGHPLERQLRDAHGAASHRSISYALYEKLGGILLGDEPTPELAGVTVGPEGRG